jgi:putative DNA primase/helicase
MSSAPAQVLAVPARVGEQHHGQVRMAYRLADAYAGRLLHVHGIGWHAFDGTRWVEDQHGAAKQAVLATLRAAMTEAVGTGKAGKVLLKDAALCDSSHGVAGVLSIAQALEPFARVVADLDADPYLLNVANGTLDLRTFALRGHDPADLITKVTRAAWRPDEPDGARWAAFLDRVLPEAAVRAFLQRVAGVGLVGKVLEHVLVILTGTGANGKTTFYVALEHALGDYAIIAEPALFLQRDGAHPTGEMDLRGVRWVAVSENDASARLAEATMKRLTGGDPIRARRMNRNFVEFTPSHTAVLVTNHLPKVRGDDPAVWRRLRVVPFNVVIPDEEQDRHLEEALALDVDAILAWAIDGYRAYDETGLAAPEQVRAATEDYHRDSDHLAAFIEECCFLGAHYHVKAGELFDAWTRWAQAEHVEAGSKKAFGLALTRLGLRDDRTMHARLWRGIGLAAEEEEDPR